MSADPRSHLVAARERIDRALSAVLDEYLTDVDEGLRSAIRYACEDGGKRFRPVLFLASYRVSGNEPTRAVERLATALEIVHSYSLVHDDLPCMDDDDWRRGRPTCHRAFGAELATLAAAAMVPLAGWVMAREAREAGLSAREAAALVEELSRAAGPAGMVGGQFLDLASEGRSVTPEELRGIHRRKTGALIEAAARLGGRAARLPAGPLGALSRYGEKIGLAFQIADDLLDADEGDEDDPVRGDRRLDKATYPWVLGHARAREEAERLAGEAVAALRDSGLRSAELETLARQVVERDR